MLSLRYHCGLATALLWLPLALAQLNIPQCISQCIDQSTDASCSLADLKCICRASNGRFLPDLVTCMKGNCDPSMDVHVLLDPLQLGCSLLGVPLSSQAVANAEGVASSLAVSTMTVTVASPSMTTVTVTSTAGGSTIVIAYPGTVGSNSVVSLGQPSTVTQSGTVSSSTPIVAGAGSTNTQSGSMLIATTTNSAGSAFTTTQKPATATSATGSIAAASAATTAQTTGAAQPTGASTTTNPNASKTSSARPADDTNGSPFGYPSAAARKGAGSWLGFSILLILVVVWV